MGRTLFLADSREMREVEMQWAGGMLLPVLEGGGLCFTWFGQKWADRVGLHSHNSCSEMEVCG